MAAPHLDNRIKIDKDPSIHFETNNIIRSIADFFFLPILNNLHINFNSGIRRSHKSAHEVIQNKTNHFALEILYNHGQDFPSENILQHAARRIWFYRNNPKGVRNRLRIVEREIGRAISDRVDAVESLNFLSIASGSARAVIETLKSFNSNVQRKVNVHFLDKSSNALKYSKKLFQLSGLAINHVRWIEDTANNFPQHFEGLLDVIEMVGLLDYFDEQQAQKTFSTIYSRLKKGGVFITANVLPNKEQKFITNVVGWKMVYRQPEELIELLEKAGFESDNIEVYVEPMKVHAIAVAKK